MSDENSRSYSVPDVEQIELMSPEEAGRAVKQLDSDVHGDAQHPYMVGGHPLHKDYVEFGLALREKAAEGRENIFDKALREGQEEQGRKQAKLRAEAEKLLDEMDSEGGFEGRERLDLSDVQPWQIELWRMQSLNQKGDFKTLLPMLEQHIQKLRLDVSTFRTLLWDEKASADDKSYMVGMLLERIWSASEKKFSVDKSLGFAGTKRKPRTVEE